MYLTSEQLLDGRRNFWRIAGRGVNPDRLKLETCIPGQMPGGPVRAGIVGVGRQGCGSLLRNCLKEFIDIQAVCDINPAHRAQASNQLVAAGGKKPREYEDWQEMADREKLEVVLVATPLWTHADIAVGFLQAGSNVFGEKMMAYDVASCRAMIDAAKTHRRLLEIGYPRFYEPLHQAVYENIIRPKVLGDIHYVRLHTHRNSSWRWPEKPPFTGYNPSRWGYPDWQALADWRMYKRYSQGLVAELGSHQTSLAEWYLGSTARSVYGSGGIYCYKDGREVNDHIFMTFDHPGGCTVELSVILSNSYGGLYEEFVGSNGTLIISDQDGGMFFPKEKGCPVGDPIKGIDETIPWKPSWEVGFRMEVWGFCSALRQGTPLLCGPERALASAASALAGNKAIATKTRVEISPV
jgi:predicted dehydrogenase